jgi:hypothetical protein
VRTKLRPSVLCNIIIIIIHRGVDARVFAGTSYIIMAGRQKIRIKTTVSFKLNNNNRNYFRVLLVHGAYIVLCVCRDDIK